MSLTILNVAYPFAPAGPDAVGGAEQVLSLIDAALVREGHRSIVIACEGSHVQGQLVTVPKTSGCLDEGARRAGQIRHARVIEQVLARQPVDVVHLHGVDFLNYLPPPGPPVLATLHLPLTEYGAGLARIHRPNTFLQCVSSTQEQTAEHLPNLLPSIENGVPIDRLDVRVRKRGYALALGRICPEKGFHIALDAAREASTPLFLGGQVFPYPEHTRYFRTEVARRLDDCRRYLGPVGLARKRRLLAGARCLLAPSLVAETSALVAMEALACGTPVIAFRAGHLARIVEHGRTGFLVADQHEMAAAIRAANQLRPEDCRAAARARFSAQRMTAQYLDCYEALAGGPGAMRLPFWLSGARGPVPLGQA